MIFIFVGLPRNLNDTIKYIEEIIDKYQALVIFSTSEDIYNYKLPKECKIIINEKSEWYKKKYKKIEGLPQYLFMIQHLRLSDAINYIQKNNLASKDTVIYKLRSDIINIDQIKIPLNPYPNSIYMWTDYAFASKFEILIKLNKFFFSRPEKFLDLDPKIDVNSYNFLNSDKKAARFEWLTYPKMISTLLPNKIFKFILKTNLEKYLFYGPKSKDKYINMRYVEDKINFQSEVMLLWSVLKNNLKINSISNSPLKLNPNRMPQKKVTRSLLNIK